MKFPLARTGAYLLILLLYITLAGYIVYQMTNRSEGGSPSFITNTRLKMLRRIVTAYGAEEEKWPALELWQDQLVQFAHEYHMRIDPSSEFVDGWNKPIMYRIEVDDSGNETVMVYSMGPNSIDDRGNNDDLVAEIVNGEIVD